MVIVADSGVAKEPFNYFKVNDLQIFCLRSGEVRFELDSGKFVKASEAFQPFIECKPGGYIGDNNGKLAAVKNGCFYCLGSQNTINKISIKDIKAAINGALPLEWTTVFKPQSKSTITDMQFNKDSELICLTVCGELFRPEYHPTSSSPAHQRTTSIYQTRPSPKTTPTSDISTASHSQIIMQSHRRL